MKEVGPKNGKILRQEMRLVSISVPYTESHTDTICTETTHTTTKHVGSVMEMANTSIYTPAGQTVKMVG